MILYMKLLIGNSKELFRLITIQFNKNKINK